MEQRCTYRTMLLERTMQFSVRVIHLVRALPRGIAEDSIAKQLVRSATSIGANYRETIHAKSKADFAAKLKICESEAAETLYWLELLIQSGTVPEHKLSELIHETRELVAIFTSSTKTAYKSV